MQFPGITLKNKCSYKFESKIKYSNSNLLGFRSNRTYSEYPNIGKNIRVGLGIHHIDSF